MFSASWSQLSLPLLTLTLDCQERPGFQHFPSRAQKELLGIAKKTPIDFYEASLFFPSWQMWVVDHDEQAVICIHPLHRMVSVTHIHVDTPLSHTKYVNRYRREKHMTLPKPSVGSEVQDRQGIGPASHDPDPTSPFSTPTPNTSRHPLNNQNPRETPNSKTTPSCIVT